MLNNSLQHYGVKGMHWGIRRYQNYDGTRIKDGKRAIKSNASSVSKKLTNPETGRKIGESKKIYDNAKAINKVLDKRTRKTVDLSNMSDQELQRAVNRLNLERNYIQLTNADKSKGSIFTSEVLDAVGDIIGIAGSAVGIALSIKALRKSPL